MSKLILVGYMIAMFLFGWVALGLWGMRAINKLLDEARKTNARTGEIQAEAWKNLELSKKVRP